MRFGQAYVRGATPRWWKVIHYFEMCTPGLIREGLPLYTVTVYPVSSS